MSPKGSKSTKSGPVVKAVQLVLVGLTLFFVIIAISSRNLSSDSQSVSPYLRNGFRKYVMSSPAPLFAALPKVNTFGIRTAPIPSFLYGTAWKKGRTEELVDLAVRNGFRGIDTACQPKHYFESGVGDALEKLFTEGFITRSDIFIQTKYTPYDGQDPNNVPYDENANYTAQVMQSYRQSLANLKTTYLDSLVLHSPMSTLEDTMEVWRAFESIHADGGVIYLGISNCYDLDVLEGLYTKAKVKPSFLQNRFYSESGYDRTIRTFCSKNNIKYQSFWSLTANPKALER